ncbi:MAG TPA: methionine--tRNA ligase [Candidatus Hydrogenedentes bacterium]|nr:methionine--tRNA ligase [Candidatus Hydrogenedentota bacterium]
MCKHSYVTTSIPYVNARPHIGHVLELVQADAIARYRRLIAENVRFQTGTDENAFKNVQAAQEQGISTQQLVDRNSAVFRALCRKLEISHDSFIRTTEERHLQGVHAFWRRLSEGDIYKKNYAGLYCLACEDFYLEKDLVDGLCPEHGSPLSKVNETNYFFRLSKYQNTLERLVASDALEVLPGTRKNEVLSFIRNGLQDISVSRPAERCGGWGIPVPGDPSQVIYVWTDALINYLSGLGFGGEHFQKEFWGPRCEEVHVIGKNVWKFHAVYWPAFLLSAGLPLPKTVLVHGFLTCEGRKVGKSLGNAIDGLSTVEELGRPAIRYYLLRAASPFQDSDFSRIRVEELYDTDLANGLGNLVSRVCALCEKARFHPHAHGEAHEAPGGFHSAMKAYRFDDALQSLWQVVGQTNADIARVEPWKTVRESRSNTLQAHLSRWVENLRCVAFWLEPFLPVSSAKILRALSGDAWIKDQHVFPRKNRGRLRAGAKRQI